MSEDKLTLVEVAAVVIVRDRKILAVFNENWGAFTLPMTKRRMWKDAGARIENEDWAHAASRAAGEWLAKTFTSPPVFCVDAPEYEQSDRDGVLKRYWFKVFRFCLDEDEDQELVHGAHAEWLTADQFLEKDRRPISPTAVALLQELMAQFIRDGKRLPWA